jgi:hypothetical protein
MADQRIACIQEGGPESRARLGRANLKALLPEEAGIEDNNIIM